MLFRSAKKELLKPLLEGFTAGFIYKGFTGATSFYPYDFFYDGDKTIDPSIKHPYYDSGYNFDVGYNASPAFSFFDSVGGPDSSSSVGTYPMLEYFVSYKYKKSISTDNSYWYYNEGVGETCSDVKKKEQSSSTEEVKNNVE